ncbi:MAG: hypothetical protein JOZ99_00095, partial [Actinobacteria bacterium]|nr:hypothetical protein [Actinomycetota bacterium]
FYVGRELLDQPFDLHQLAAFWTRDLLTSLPVVSALAIVGCAAVVRAARGAPRGGAPVLLASVVGLVAAGWVGRIHSGGYANVLMPAYAGLAVVAGIGAHRVRNRARRRLSSVARRVATASFLVAVGVQLAALTYPARAQIPTRADSRAGDRFLELVRSLPGRVVVLIHPWYGTVAGKGDFAAGAAVQDLLRSQPSRARVALVRDERTALLAPDIGAVVLDQAPDPILAPQLAGSYTKVSDRAIIGTAFFPVTDLRLRPAFVYVRDGPRPGATQVVADERRG